MEEEDGEASSDGGSGNLAALRRRCLQRCGLGLEHSLRPDGRLARPLVAALRVLAASAAELERVRGGRADPLKARQGLPACGTGAGYLLRLWRPGAQGCSQWALSSCPALCMQMA